MKRGLAVAETEKIVPMKKMVGPLAPQTYTTTVLALDTRTVLLVILSFLVGFLLASYGPRIVTGLQISAGRTDLLRFSGSSGSDH